jgi:leucyl/phenylalanyl-tRNA---protein transferase
MGAYRAGIFPMANPRTGAIDWWSPDPRAIMPLPIQLARRASEGSSSQARSRPSEACVHFSRSLMQRVRSGRFTITSDVAFHEVIRACATPRPVGEAWISPSLVHAYTLLHDAGHAHSVEAWLSAEAPVAEGRSEAPVVRTIRGVAHRLVGGLYGVHIGAAFFGESMFSRPTLGGTDASKVCLVHLWTHLVRRGFELLDTQLSNEHMEQFGVVEIPREEYLKRLARAIQRPVEWGPLESGVTNEPRL